MIESGIPWIGLVPSDWTIEKNKMLFDYSKEIVGEKSADTILLSLTTQGIKEKEIGLGGGKVPDSFDTYQVVHVDDIVLCLFDLDVSAVFSGVSPYNGMISPAYKIVKCKERILPKYADYWFQFVFDGRKFKAYAKNLRYTLNYNEFKMLPILLPSIEEQEYIVAFLDKECEEIGKVITKTKESIETYKRMKQALITKVALRGLEENRNWKDSGIQWIEKIPEEWAVYKNSLLFKENVRTPEEGDIPLSLSQVDGLIATEDMKESSLKTSTYDGWKKVKINDLVLNRFKAHLGVMFAASIEGMVSFHYGVFEPQKELNTKYYEYLCHTDQYKAIYANKSNGMVVGLQNLSNQNFYSVKSIYPPIEEQYAIVEYLDVKCAEIDNTIRKKEQLIEKLDAYKKTLVYEYITGKRRVVD